MVRKPPRWRIGTWALLKNNKNKTQHPPWTSPYMEQLRASRGNARPCRAALLAVWRAVWDSWGQACFQEENLPQKATNVWAPQQQAGGPQQQEDEACGLWRKGEVLH